MTPESTRKNLRKMLKVLQENLKGTIKFKAPFTSHCLKIRTDLLTNFCRNLRQVLLEENKVKAYVKEFRPMFVLTWIIML